MLFALIIDRDYICAEREEERHVRPLFQERRDLVRRLIAKLQLPMVKFFHSFGERALAADSMAQKYDIDTLFEELVRSVEKAPYQFLFVLPALAVTYPLDSCNVIFRAYGIKCKSLRPVECVDDDCLIPFCMAVFTDKIHFLCEHLPRRRAWKPAYIHS